MGAGTGEEKREGDGEREKETERERGRKRPKKREGKEREGERARPLRPSPRLLLGLSFLLFGVCFFAYVVQCLCIAEELAKLTLDLLNTQMLPFL